MKDRITTHRKPKLRVRVRPRGEHFGDWMYLACEFNTPRHFEDWMQQEGRDLINFEYEMVWI